MTWNIDFRGFLPAGDPSVPCPLDELMRKVPDFIESRRIREELVVALRRWVRFPLDNTDSESPPSQKFTDLFCERMMGLYSYFASAYVYARHENPADHIPVEIAGPLVEWSNRVGRPPILSYASYCLTNWRRLDPNKPVELGNIELLQNFCAPEVGKRDEDWFILIHVDIEARAIEAIRAISDIDNRIQNDDLALYNTFVRIINSLRAMNQTLARMPEECSPDNYYRWVRPYIFGFKDIVYEGCFDNKPQTFRGETGAESSIVPALLVALGIQHKDSMLTHHLTEMRDYMPPKHREFLQNLTRRLTNNSLREAVGKLPSCREAYNECVEQLLNFRSMHFEYAVNYIAKKVENPEGTGGTPYIPWLQQLKEETQAHLLPG